MPLRHAVLEGHFFARRRIAFSRRILRIGSQTAAAGRDIEAVGSGFQEPYRYRLGGRSLNMGSGL